MRIPYIIIIFSLLFFTAYGQPEKEKMRPIDKLYNTIEPSTYKSMPQYFIEANQNGCFYELYVNGRMVFSHFENTNLLGHTTSTNDAILKSGLQNVTVKLYPIGEYNGKNYDTFSKNAEIEIDIKKWDKVLDNKEHTKAYEDYDEHVITFKIPQIEDKNNSIKIKGLPYYEHTFTFHAEVPYTVKGWSESQDLTKMDQDVLEKEILSFYENYADIIHRQDEKSWVELVKNREFEYIKSVAYNDVRENEIQRRIKEFKEFFDSNFKKKEPLDTYEIIFGYNGRLVTLKSIDSKGDSALSYGIESEENGEMVKFRYYSYLYLHKPIGSNTLELIR